jgi:serine/threonine-protein kinase
MVARAYPNGGPPPDVQQASDAAWELAAKASRLEGELASLSRKLEAIERRGRALRAEIGRKVEELAHEESRALRAASDERERASRVLERVTEAETRHGAAAERAIAAERAGTASLSVARAVFEEVGAARATVEALKSVAADHEGRAQARETIARDLRRQIDDLKAQLQRYGDALETDLSSGRDRIAKRVREALTFEKSFADASALLMTHLRGKPECRDLLDEIARRDSTVVELGSPQTRSPMGTPPGVPTL